MMSDIYPVIYMCSVLPFRQSIGDEVHDLI